MIGLLVEQTGESGFNSRWGEDLYLRLRFQIKYDDHLELHLMCATRSFPEIKRPERDISYLVRRKPKHNKLKLKLNSMVWVRERTMQTERPPIVGEVIANFCG
jgi:hypothetical protein